MRKAGIRNIRKQIFCLFLPWLPIFSAFSQSETKHQIHIIHKGISLSETIESELVEARNHEQVPEFFFMDVESVVCGDSVCRVDIVRLYWDKYARFLRLELPGEVELEKAEGKAFSKEDYQKLDKVLANENSPLNDLYSDQIVGTLASEGVDAVSRASVSINTKDYVEGAIWTCYSLWHWVHGDTKDIIRNLTGDVLTPSQLTALLSSREIDLQVFALEQLRRREEFSEGINEYIIEALKNSPNLIVKSLEYWERCPELIYKKALKQVLASPEKEIRFLCLGSLFQSKYLLTETYILDLPISYEQMSYQEVQLFLRILHKHAISSSALTEKFIGLLDQEDFLIARAVYWFLTEQELNDKQQHRLTDFHAKWKRKL